MYLEEQLSVTMIGQKFLESFVTSYDYTNGSIEFGLNVHAHLGSTLKNLAEQGADEAEPTEPPEEEIVIVPEEPEPT